MDYKIERKLVDNLELDWKNPRLAEFGIKQSTPPEEIFSILWQNMALEEIVTSLVAHGFFDTEPLIVLEEQGKLIVLEGNRRLAAVKIVRNPILVENKLDATVLQRITPEIINSLDKLPVIVVGSRQEAWRFIGFKHINGPAKWNSFAKAQHIAQVHKEYNIPLDEIAFQVGDTHKTVQKLFQGMMVIEQAERERIFDREDIKKGRLYFSHLYTALQYEGFKEYLSINDANMEDQAPVPIEKKENLQELLLWLYGSKKRTIDPIIKTQNPDLKRLENVIQNREAIAALKTGISLEASYELSRPRSTVFEESLFAAKREIQRAWSNVSEGFNGSIELLRTAGTIASIADELYSKMEEKSNTKSKVTKKRLKEE
jgi:ParB-like nuclease domain